MHGGIWLFALTPVALLSRRQSGDSRGRWWRQRPRPLRRERRKTEWSADLMGMEVSLLSHLTNSAMIVYLLQYLKGTDWYRRFAAWMPMEEQKVHVLMSFIGAAATGMGMHGAVEGSSVAGWQIALTIPPLWVMLHALWDTAQQMAL